MCSMGKRKLYYAQKRRVSRGMAFALSLAMVGGMVPAGIMSVGENVKAAATEFTDDASVVEKAGFPLSFMEGNRLNIKITTPEDMRLAEAILSIGLDNL